MSKAQTEVMPNLPKSITYYVSPSESARENFVVSSSVESVTLSCLKKGQEYHFGRIILKPGAKLIIEQGVSVFAREVVYDEGSIIEGCEHLNLVGEESFYSEQI